MTEYELPPMASGGAWMQSSSDREPHYVVHEAHIARLRGEGWQHVADPRKPRAKPVTEPTAADIEKEEMKQRIAKLEAMLAQVLVPKDNPVVEDVAEPASDDSTTTKPARRQK